MVGYERTKEMFDYYEQRRSLAEVGKLFGISKQAVQQAFKRYGFSRRAIGIRLDADRNRKVYGAKYYITDETGFRMRDENGDEFLCETIEIAERWINLYFQVYQCRYFWLRTESGEIVCQYVRDALAT